MAQSAKLWFDIAVGSAVVGLRGVRAKSRNVGRLFTSPDAVRVVTDTPLGAVELTQLRPEEHTGPHHQYAVSVAGVSSGHVTTLLDLGSASAVIVCSIESNQADSIVPEVVIALVARLRVAEPWLRRASIALAPNSEAQARPLIMRGFDCEGAVPGYVQDAPGSKRQLWTLLLN